MPTHSHTHLHASLENKYIKMKQGICRCHQSVKVIQNYSPQHFLHNQNTLMQMDIFGL